MRARPILAAALLAGLLAGPAAALADHDCGNGKSQDHHDDDRDCKKQKDRDRGRRHTPPPPREEWPERDTARVELRLSVDVSVVAPSVPHRYQIALSGGRATVLVTARSFEDGTPGTVAVLHEASVLVTAPDGSAGVHAYVMWQVTDSAGLAARLRRMGLPVTELAAPYSTTSVGVAAQLQADVDLAGAGYSFVGSVSESAGASTGTPNLLWYDGALGTVRVSTTCGPCGTPGTGAVALSASADSRVSTYISAEAAVTPASFVRSSGVSVAVVVG